MIDALGKNISSRVQAIVNNFATLINDPRKKSRDQQLNQQRSPERVPIGNTIQ